jgi:hypothetical protein
VWDLLWTVAPLALASAITPTLFALQVLVVSGPSPRTQGRAVILGAGGVFVLLFALVLGGLSQLPDAGTGQTSTAEYVIEGVCGLVLVAVAIWLLRPHPRADARMEEKVKGYAAHASPWMFVGLAAYMTATDFSSFLVLIPALHDVTSSSVAMLEKAVVVGLLLLFAMLPVLAPPLAVQLAGERGVRMLRRTYAAVMGHQLEVMGAVALIVGAVLLYRGFIALI